MSLGPARSSCPFQFVPSHRFLSTLVLITRKFTSIFHIILHSHSVISLFCLLLGISHNAANSDNSQQARRRLLWHNHFLARKHHNSVHGLSMQHPALGFTNSYYNGNMLQHTSNRHQRCNNLLSPLLSIWRGPTAHHVKWFVLLHAFTLSPPTRTWYMLHTCKCKKESLLSLTPTVQDCKTPTLAIVLDSHAVSDCGSLFSGTEKADIKSLEIVCSKLDSEQESNILHGPPPKRGLKRGNNDVGVSVNANCCSSCVLMWCNDVLWFGMGVVWVLLRCVYVA